MSRPLKPEGRPSKVDSDESTYKLSTESPVAPEGIVPPPPVKNYVSKRNVRARSAGSGTLIGFNLLVFLTSVCVMTLELTASRLIAKHVGSSLYTWTSVIGVVLAGITLGNWLGGWMADRYDRSRSLAWMYLLGSISCGGVLWLDQLIGTISRPETISWQNWVLVVVASIFLLPALALGATSPLVASMALDRGRQTGSTVGNVYAWGALGSIVGTFLTGFYLIDVWGSRSIVGMTAATLAILAVLVAGSRIVFRTGVMLGWLQLLGWTMLFANANGETIASMGGTAADWMSVMRPEAEAKALRENYVASGRSLGDKLHELGLVLNLRDDGLKQYHDESNYFDIVVSDAEQNGKVVKSLKLDKLIHSYYDPENPTAMHYEYEQIYAAVTRKVTWGTMTEPLTLPLSGLVGANVDALNLPRGVTLDNEQQMLRIERPTSDLFTRLIAFAPEAAYWRAIEQLQHETNKEKWGGYSAVKLSRIPEGATIPDDIARFLRHDETLEFLIAYQPVSTDIRDRLVEKTQSGPWYQKINDLRRRWGQSSACFYGGGGYIFPRWFLQEFPGSSTIDVAELDPAVHDAVTHQLGMTNEQDQRIHTTTGDARNFVEDRLRENVERKNRNQSPLTYDFIYGDAFSDFSIPFHLTTVEFLQRTRDLMSERGVFQANVIDIYPRTEFPGTTVGKGEAEYAGRLPNGLLDQEVQRDQPVPAVKKFAPLEVMELLTNKYRLRIPREINENEKQRLLNVNWPALKPRGEYDVTKGVQVAIDLPEEQKNWRTAIEELSSQAKRKVSYTGTIPAELNLTGGAKNEWIPAAVPFEFVEAMQIDNEKYLLGFRGVLSSDAVEKLVRLDPQNQEWSKAIIAAKLRSESSRAGRFLGRYVASATRVFPNVYLFSASLQRPDAIRDTYVMVCSQKPLDLTSLEDTGEWSGQPFAAIEAQQGHSASTMSGQMSSVLALAQGQVLTDDFAPVENLLIPVIDTQE